MPGLKPVVTRLASGGLKAKGPARAQAAGLNAIFWRVLPRNSRTCFSRAVVVQNGFT